MAAYLDTSALVKLIIAEPESAALRSWLLAKERSPVTSDLARTELVRAVRRLAPEQAPIAVQLLESVTVTEVTPAVFRAAGLVEPVALRSLDAIHLSAALDLGDDLHAFVTYDDRQTAAATANGISVIAPS